MTKISVSIPEEIIDFIDKQGKNRSKTIVTILEDFKIRKQQDELEKAYEDYYTFYEEDEESKDFENASLIDIGKDL
jgi:metal-responsive CopG/Arc/MetJ family transcriptional regulator